MAWVWDKVTGEDPTCGQGPPLWKQEPASNVCPTPGASTGQGAGPERHIREARARRLLIGPPRTLRALTTRQPATCSNTQLQREVAHSWRSHQASCGPPLSSALPCILTSSPTLPTTQQGHSPSRAKGPGLHCPSIHPSPRTTGGQEPRPGQLTRHGLEQMLGSSIWAWPWKLGGGGESGRRPVRTCQGQGVAGDQGQERGRRSSYRSQSLRRAAESMLEGPAGSTQAVQGVGMWEGQAAE